MKQAPCAIALLALACTSAAAQTAEDFYRGKTLRVIVGYAVGGGYDIYGRAFAEWFGRYVPGNPTIIPQNMPGAGSLNAYNYIYNVAPKDGTAFGTGHRFVPLMPLLGLPGAQFDGAKFTYIGSANREVDICMIRTDSGVTTLDQWKQREVMVGTTGGGVWKTADSGKTWNPDRRLLRRHDGRSGSLCRQPGYRVGRGR